VKTSVLQSRLGFTILAAMRSIFEILIRRLVVVIMFGIAIAPLIARADSHPSAWDYAWPRTDFATHSVPFGDILSGGPPKDGIPSIDNPVFIPVADVTSLSDTEPVIGLHVGGEAKAYPLQVLTWHEIVNDEIAGIPVTVTFCPLCNSAIVFDRRLEGRVLDFGTTGNLRNSDLVMYDRQTETWWQQFLGQGIIGDLTGKSLTMMPSRLESWASFRKRSPNGQVLVPNDPNMRSYGRNPYAGYDSADFPFLYRGEMPKDVNPMVRVIAVDDQAWTLPLLRQRISIEAGDLRLTWRPGQNSALDSAAIAQGRDVGNVVVQRQVDGEWRDIVHDITFAFVFHAFRPDGMIHAP